MLMFNLMTTPLGPSLKSIPFLKEVPARALRAAGREAKWFSIHAGMPLFLRGERSSSIFFVISGTLGAFRTSPDGRTELVGHIRAGEPVGEMALFLAEDENGDGELQDAPHTNSVYALRDTELLCLSRKGFDRLIKAEPEILEAMIRLILMRLKQTGRRSERSEPRVFTLVATSPTIDLKLRATALCQALEELGLTAVVVDKDKGDEKPSSFFDDLEARHDIVILLTPLRDDGWYRLAMRQADRIWVLGRGDAHPSNPLMPADDSPARAFKLIDVILLHHTAERRAAGPDEWRAASGASRVFHWCDMHGADCQRLARVMAGRSVGLVLSGGGARAYAHIGVIRAMRELGVPIDFVGGVSMGGVIGACVAMGWDDDEIDQRIRKSFVDSNPLGDWTLPVVAMVRGKRVDARLKEHFGEAKIGELDLPFFCVSTNLTDGAFRVHRDGLLRRALRASISLPGILPPVVDDGEVLVDGAVLNNFPCDVMRDFHRGTLVGCDVARAPQGLSSHDFEQPKGFFSWVFEHGFSSAPPIAGLLMRSATLHNDPSEARNLADILVVPELENIELRNWKAYDEAVEAGYRAALAALAGRDCTRRPHQQAGDTVPELLEMV